MSKKPGPSARDIWGEMFDLLIRSAPRRTEGLSRRGLTPNDARALHSLHDSDGRSMRSLADEWGCDPSYATAVIGHLEELGLAERNPSPDDRRVTLVALTRRGKKLREDLLEEFHEPPPDFSKLDKADLEHLGRILKKLAAK